MILTAVGDSFVYGSELGDETTYQHSNLTFPSLLAKENNIDYRCVAKPGNSNSAIARMAMTACAESLKKNEHPVVLVLWTFMQRAEFRFREANGYEGWESINIQDAAISIGSPKEEFAHRYFKLIGSSEYYELYSTFKEIVFLQQYLKINNIPYIFATADGATLNGENYVRHKDPTLDALHNQIDLDNWFIFPDGAYGFYDWAVQNKYEQGPGKHPLHEAHIDTAKLMQGKFNEMVTKNSY